MEGAAAPLWSIPSSHPTVSGLASFRVACLPVPFSFFQCNARVPVCLSCFLNLRGRVSVACALNPQPSLQGAVREGDLNSQAEETKKIKNTQTNNPPPSPILLRKDKTTLFSTRVLPPPPSLPPSNHTTHQKYPHRSTPNSHYHPLLHPLEKGRQRPPPPAQHHTYVPQPSPPPPPPLSLPGLPAQKR